MNQANVREGHYLPFTDEQLLGKQPILLRLERNKEELEYYSECNTGEPIAGGWSYTYDESYPRGNAALCLNGSPVDRVSVTVFVGASAACVSSNLEYYPLAEKIVDANGSIDEHATKELELALESLAEAYYYKDCENFEEEFGDSRGMFSDDPLHCAKTPYFIDENGEFVRPR